MWGIQIVFAWLIVVDLPGRIIRNSSKIKQDRGDSLINLSLGQTYVTKHDLYWLGCQPQYKIGLFCCSLITFLKTIVCLEFCFCHWFHFGFASEESCKMQTVQFTMMMWTNYRLCLWASAYIYLILFSHTGVLCLIILLTLSLEVGSIELDSWTTESGVFSEINWAVYCQSGLGLEVIATTINYSQGKLAKCG